MNGYYDNTYEFIIENDYIEINDTYRDNEDVYLQSDFDFEFEAEYNYEIEIEDTYRG